MTIQKVNVCGYAIIVASCIFYIIFHKGFRNGIVTVGVVIVQREHSLTINYSIISLTPINVGYIIGRVIVRSIDIRTSRV